MADNTLEYRLPPERDSTESLPTYRGLKTFVLGFVQGWQVALSRGAAEIVGRDTLAGDAGNDDQACQQQAADEQANGDEAAGHHSS